jgi:cell division protease FtsH
MGVTFALPEEDRRTYTKAYIVGRLAVAHAGRAAEEIVFGPDRVTTGAASDFQQATELARQMVTRFGMSELVGPVAVIEHPEVGLFGREVIQRHEVSPQTAELIDREVRRLVAEAATRAGELIRANRATLDALASALLDRETLERAEVEAIVARRGESAAVQPAPPPARAA